MSDNVEYPQFSAEGLPLTYVPNPYSADGKPADNQWKEPVRVHTVVAVVLSGLHLVDSIAVMEGDRVLVKDQVDPTQNGIYVASATSWRRAPDMYLWPQFPGAVVATKEGITPHDTVWLCQAAPMGTLGVTPNYWIPVSTSPGTLGMFTPLQAIVSDVSGNAASSPTTAQEIAFLGGVTSAVQQQFNYLYNEAGAAYSIAQAGTNAAATAQGTASSALSVASSAYTLAEAGTNIGSLAYNAVTALGDKYVRTTRFATIGAGTSGAVTLPPNATVVLDDFGGTSDAVVTGLISGRPTYSHVFTAAGAIVSTTFDLVGNYDLSGAPNAYPVALVYRVRQKLSDFDSLSPDIIGGYDVEALDSITGTPNQILVNGTTGASQYGGVILTTPQDIGPASTPTFANVNAQNVFTANAVASAAYALAQLGTIPPPLAQLPDVSVPAPFVNQVLMFDGSRWQARTPSSAPAAGVGLTYFLDGTDASFPGYESLVTTVEAVPQVESVLVYGTDYFLIDEYISGTLGQSSLDGGGWVYQTYASADVAPCYVKVDTFILSGTTERSLWSLTTPVLTPAVALSSNEIYAGSLGVSETDRLLLRYYGTHGGGGAGTHTITLYHSGSLYASHVDTPLNLLHNVLAGLQGGATNQFYHVTHTISDALSAADNPSGTNVFVTDSDPRLAQAQSALSISNSAYALAQIGTNTGTAAHTLAQSAYNLASNTGTYALTSILSGTTLVPAAPLKRLYLVDTTGASTVLALPNALGWAGQILKVKKTSTDGNAIILRSATGTQAVDGSSQQSFTYPYTAIELTTDGNNWYIV